MKKMARFFIPDASDSEAIYRAIKLYLSAAGFGVNDERIYSLTYSGRGGAEVTDTVGRENEATGLKVVAIFNTGSMFLICTPGRGVQGETPIIVGNSEVLSSSLFEQ